MNQNYTDEKNVQIVIALLKEYGIKRIIASPGSTNLGFVWSVQKDSYFEVFSVVDERSAAYMACGMAAESLEPVVISCTGATASRNYLSGLTEAYYRKLPILALASSQTFDKVGQNIAQITDRTLYPKDVSVYHTSLQPCYSEYDQKVCSRKVNEALLALKRNGGGPVLIDLITTHEDRFSTSELPHPNSIKRISYEDKLFPDIEEGPTAIYVGAHLKWGDELTKSVDRFCERYNGVVICDQTSNYRGKYRIFGNIVLSQIQYDSPCKKCKTLIHIGDISGAYVYLDPQIVWRVNSDGEIRETFNEISYVFQMNEQDFFDKYNDEKEGYNCAATYYGEWRNEIEKFNSKISQLPFSNIWIAKMTAPLIPKGAVVHLGILNSLRAWNMFETPEETCLYANTGGFGTDGGLSSLVGASLVNPNKLYFGVIGDLAFFYDMNALGNRHIGNNLRIILINNGRGTEFRNYGHVASILGEDVNPFIAASGHYGNKSKELVKDYAENLGFDYMSASNKKEYQACLPKLISGETGNKSVILEVFTDSNQESLALEIMLNLEIDKKHNMKKAIKGLIGEKGVNIIKKGMGL